MCSCVCRRTNKKFRADARRGERPGLGMEMLYLLFTKPGHQSYLVTESLRTGIYFLDYYVGNGDSCLRRLIQDIYPSSSFCLGIQPEDLVHTILPFQLQRISTVLSLQKVRFNKVSFLLKIITWLIISEERYTISYVVLRFDLNENSIRYK